MLHTKFQGYQPFGYQRRRFFKGFYHIWAWRPYCSCDLDHLNKLSFPHPMEASHEIWLQSAQWFQRRWCLKMLAEAYLYYKLTNETNEPSGDLKMAVATGLTDNRTMPHFQGSSQKSKHGSRWLKILLPEDSYFFSWEYMGRVKRIWYLSPMRAAKIQASLRIRAVSPEPSLLAHTSSESRGTFRQKTRSLAPLNGWTCAVEICHDGMLEDTKSLDAAHIKLSFWYSYFF